MDAACSFIQSYHVYLRMIERNFEWNDILFVLLNGIEIENRGGRRKFYLRAKDISPMVNLNRRYDHLVGMTVIVDRHKRVVITAYRQSQLYN